MPLGKLESAIWFLKRPKLFPQFVHLVGRKIFGRREVNTRVRSERWCERYAIDVEEAIERVTGARMGRSVAEQYPEVFAGARLRVQGSPVEMGGPGVIDLLYWIVSRGGAKRAIETGVAYGWSSLAILLAQKGLEGARLTSIDMPYVRADSDSYVGIAVPEELKSGNRWELIRRADRQALPGALRRLHGIDFCHYDSDKTYAGRMWAYPRLWAALRAGGCFVSDDIGDNVGFRDFAEHIGVSPVVVRAPHGGKARYAGILVKPVGAGR